ncbi:Aste57867_21469 [Aphanomyces stellatus]|uniref:Aste57867_21469 protein n=1 Tax=Aphanomyces stellatus TaxID=120398 RepID=A0A485LIA6_9STRA|nr:hypothetical protein As57867_021400 [Aphanomyces stellatus]VFT98140.1 Aste57867_21469 [Aphanomyces stellatus]
MSASYVQALRNYVIESLQDVDAITLDHLCETFHLDRTTFPTKQDLIRSLVDLIVMDRDTALGLFVAWKQSLASGGGGAVVLEGANFANAFLPIPGPSPRKASTGPPTTPKTMFDFVLDRELATIGTELGGLEKEYKMAERALHQGGVNYDKIKRFLQTLTQLRAKDDQFRILLLEKNQNLRADNARLFKLEAHTRQQLDFFVDGCDRLRKKHDATVEEVFLLYSRIAGVEAAAHEFVVQLYSGECAFTQALTATLQFKCQRLVATEDALTKSKQNIAELEATVAQKNIQLEIMHAKWDDAVKEAMCSRVQLRKSRKRLREQEVQAIDSKFLRLRALYFQRMACDLFSLSQVQTAALHDAKGPFTKSTEHSSLAWRVLRYLETIVAPTLDPSVLTCPSKFPTIQLPPTTRRDVRDDIPLVLLTGGGNVDMIASAVHRLSNQFGYSVLDVDTWRHDLAPPPESPGPESDPPPPVVLEPNYHARLALAIQMSGSVLLYNWTGVTASDVHRLVQHGAPPVMVLDVGTHLSTTTTSTLASLTKYHRWPAPPHNVDQMVHDVASWWQAAQDRQYGTVVVEWDSVTASMNERCAMLAEEMNGRMAVEWAKHLASLAEKKAAADAVKAKQAAAKKRGNTPSQKDKPATPAKGKKAVATKSPGKPTTGKPKPPTSPPKSTNKPNSPPKSPAEKSKKTPATPARRAK